MIALLTQDNSTVESLVDETAEGFVRLDGRQYRDIADGPQPTTLTTSEPFYKWNGSWTITPTYALRVMIPAPKITVAEVSGGVVVRVFDTGDDFVLNPTIHRTVINGTPPAPSGTGKYVTQTGWTLTSTTATRVWTELNLPAATATGLKKERILSILADAMAGEVDPDFSTIAPNFPLELKSRVNTLIANATAAIQARMRNPVVQFVTPTNGQTQTFGTTGAWEIIACDHNATIATQTFVFPSNANSDIGQEIRIFSRAAITTVTLTTTGLTIRGAALTALAANGTAAWRKVAASTWVRIQ